MNSPTGSSPTAVMTAALSPRRRAPTAMLVGEPPTYAANDLMSTNAAPTSLAYRSIDERPIVIRSHFGPAGRTSARCFLAVARVWLGLVRFMARCMGRLRTLAAAGFHFHRDQRHTRI